MSENIFLLTISIPLVTIMLIFAMKYLASVQQAKARLASDEAYRLLAEKAAASQADTASSLAALKATLAEVQQRVAVIENVLKEVE